MAECLAHSADGSDGRDCSSGFLLRRWPTDDVLLAWACVGDGTKSIGYDSCPMIGFMIAVGKAVKPAMPKGGQLALSEVVVQDRFE
jgi:hypothetical protein